MKTFSEVVESVSEFAHIKSLSLGIGVLEGFS